MVSCCVYCQPAKRGIVAQRVEQQFACKAIQPRAMQHNVSGGQRTDREVSILPGYLFLYFDELPKELSEYRQIDGLYYFLRYGDGTYALRGSDERFAVDKSTDAAARILRDLKKTLGSWPLAVMAYNCGAGRVRKAVIACGTTDAWTVWKRVPSETRAYLPSLIAVGYLMEYGNEYGIKQ